MDNQRLILFVALSLIVLLIWQAWQDEYGPKKATVTEPSSVVSQTGDAVPSAMPDVPSAQSAPQAVPAATSPETGPEHLSSGQRIHIKTDVLDLEVDTVGGDLRQADLLEYPVSVREPDHPVRLMGDSPDRFFIAQTGLIASKGELAPDHHAQFTAQKLQYSLHDHEDTLVVPLFWKSPNGITVEKRYLFHRNSYVVDVTYTVHNGSEKDQSMRFYRQLQRTPPGEANNSRFAARTFTGGAIYSEQDKYEKIKFDEMDDKDLSRDIKGGWAAIMEHYFLGAWIPEQSQSNHFYTKKLSDQRYVIGLISPALVIPAGQDMEFGSQLYIGPKILKRMEKVAPGLELTIDYGMLTVISKPLFWLMNYIHHLIGNWGWSIVMVTILIKLAFFKLSAASYKSMANMRKMQPKITALRERYGDDRQRMSQAMMELYKKEKINPLGGCLPMIVQIPVFIALYWVLLESVELRQADFVLWIHDLSSKDPYYVLPLLMGATMFFQQRLNPPPPDPVQAKVLMALPFIFTLFFAFFPAGLVLYWLTNSALSIAQQWMITRRIEKAASHE